MVLRMHTVLSVPETPIGMTVLIVNEATGALPAAGSRRTPAAYSVTMMWSAPMTVSRMNRCPSSAERRKDGRAAGVASGPATSRLQAVRVAEATARAATRAGRNRVRIGFLAGCGRVGVVARNEVRRPPG